MKERPILFSAPMVRAILEGRKTQTRRVVKMPNNVDVPILHKFHKGTYGTNYGGRPFGVKDGFVPLNEFGGIATKAFHDHHILCPYGKPGDRLWVRETFGIWHPLSGSYPDRYEFRADGLVSGEPFPCSEAVTPFKWRPAIHMPRAASRITLEITEVRVQRLQDISAGDVLAEGLVKGKASGRFARCQAELVTIGPYWYTAQSAFEALWESINGEGSWNANPWVWCVSFQRMKANG